MSKEGKPRLITANRVEGFFFFWALTFGIIMFLIPAGEFLVCWLLKIPDRRIGLWIYGVALIVTLGLSLLMGYQDYRREVSGKKLKVLRSYDDYSRPKDPPPPRDGGGF